MPYASPETSLGRSCRTAQARQRSASSPPANSSMVYVEVSIEEERKANRDRVGVLTGAQRRLLAGRAARHKLGNAVPRHRLPTPEWRPAPRCAALASWASRRRPRAAHLCNARAPIRARLSRRARCRRPRLNRGHTIALL